MQGGLEAPKSSKIARLIKENHVTPLNLPVAPVNYRHGRVQDWVIVLRTNHGNNVERDGDAGRIDEPRTVMVTRAQVVGDEQQPACGALQKIDALQ